MDVLVNSPLYNYKTILNIKVPEIAYVFGGPSEKNVRPH